MENNLIDGNGGIEEFAHDMNIYVRTKQTHDAKGKQTSFGWTLKTCLEEFTKNPINIFSTTHHFELRKIFMSNTDFFFARPSWGEYENVPIDRIIKSDRYSTGEKVGPIT